MNRLLILSILFSFSFLVVAQTTRNSNAKLYRSAVNLSESGDNEKAIDLFKRVLIDEPENINVLYNLGHSYFAINNRADSASIYFNKAVGILGEEAYNTELGIDLFMSLAKSNQLQYKFEDAINNYNSILSFVGEEHLVLRGVIKREIQTCNNAIELVENPVKLEVHNLGKNINSKYDDHSPLVSADENVLLFTSKRISSYSRIMDDGQFSEKVFSSQMTNGSWGKSEVLKSIVSLDSHEAGVCLSADGLELYLLISDINGQNLYVSNFDGETWTEPYKLPEGINSRFDETHASINADKSMLFFTSDRKGGAGGLDIYMVRKLPNGEWGKPRNMGVDINTEFDEETPMIHPDGKTLYFSSEGNNSMGGFDIFYSKMSADSSWSKPMNMGYPINTPDDDFFFVPTASPNKAYMASARFEDNYGGSDLYLIEYEEPLENKLALVKGKLINDKDVDWDEARIVVKEEGTDQVVGEYKPNPETGNYLMILEVDKKYDVTYKGVGFESKSSQLTIGKDMTYRSGQQTIEMDDVWIAAVESPKKDQKVGVVHDVNKKYTVQFLTLKSLIESHIKFGKLDAEQIIVYKCNDGRFRYVYGQFKTFKEARKAKAQVKKLTGYEDSFVRYFWQLDKMKVEK